MVGVRPGGAASCRDGDKVRQEFLVLPDNPLAVDEALSTHYLELHAKTEVPWARSRGRGRADGPPPFWQRGAHGENFKAAWKDCEATSLLDPATLGTAFERLLRYRRQLERWRKAGEKAASRTGAPQDEELQQEQREDDNTVRAHSVAVQVVMCSAADWSDDEAIGERLKYMANQTITLAHEKEVDPLDAVDQMQAEFRKLGFPIYEARKIIASLRAQVVTQVLGQIIGSPERVRAHRAVVDEAQKLVESAWALTDQFLEKTSGLWYKTTVAAIEDPDNIAEAIEAHDKTMESLHIARRQLRTTQASIRSCQRELMHPDDTTEIENIQREIEESRSSFQQFVETFVERRQEVAREFTERYVQVSEKYEQAGLQASELLKEAAERNEITKQMEHEVERAQAESEHLQFVIVERGHKRREESVAYKVATQKLDAEKKELLAKERDLTFKLQAMKTANQQVRAEVEQTMMPEVAKFVALTAKESLEAARRKHAMTVLQAGELRRNIASAKEKLERCKWLAISAQLQAEIEKASEECEHLRAKVNETTQLQELMVKYTSQLEAYLRKNGQNWRIDDATGLLTERQPEPTLHMNLMQINRDMLARRGRRPLRAAARRAEFDTRQHWAQQRSAYQRRPLMPLAVMAEPAAMLSRSLPAECPDVFVFGCSSTSNKIGAEARAWDARLAAKQMRVRVTQATAGVEIDPLHVPAWRACLLRSVSLPQLAAQQKLLQSSIPPRLNHEQIIDGSTTQDWERQLAIWCALWGDCLELLETESGLGFGSAHVFLGRQRLSEALKRLQALIIDGYRCTCCLQRLHLVISNLESMGYKGESMPYTSTEWAQEILEEIKLAWDLLQTEATTMAQQRHFVALAVASLLRLVKRAVQLQQEFAQFIDAAEDIFFATSLLLGCSTAPERVYNENTVMDELQDCVVRCMSLRDSADRLRADVDALFGTSGPVSVLEAKPRLCSHDLLCVPRFLADLARSRLQNHSAELHDRLMRKRKEGVIRNGIDARDDKNEINFASWGGTAVGDAIDSFNIETVALYEDDDSQDDSQSDDSRSDNSRLDDHRKESHVHSKPSEEQQVQSVVEHDSCAEQQHKLRRRTTKKSRDRKDAKSPQQGHCDSRQRIKKAAIAAMVAKPTDVFKKQSAMAAKELRESKQINTGGDGGFNDLAKSQRKIQRRKNDLDAERSVAQTSTDGIDMLEISQAEEVEAQIGIEPTPIDQDSTSPFELETSTRKSTSFQLSENLRRSRLSSARSTLAGQHKRNSASEFMHRVRKSGKSMFIPRDQDLGVTSTLVAGQELLETDSKQAIDYTMTNRLCSLLEGAVEQGNIVKRRVPSVRNQQRLGSLVDVDERETPDWESGSPTSEHVLWGSPTPSLTGPGLPTDGDAADELDGVEDVHQKVLIRRQTSPGSSPRWVTAGEISRREARGGGHVEPLLSRWNTELPEDEGLVGESRADAAGNRARTSSPSPPPGVGGFGWGPRGRPPPAPASAAAIASCAKVREASHRSRSAEEWERRSQSPVVQQCLVEGQTPRRETDKRDEGAGVQPRGTGTPAQQFQLQAPEGWARLQDLDVQAHSDPLESSLQDLSVVGSELMMAHAEDWEWTLGTGGTTLGQSSFGRRTPTPIQSNYLRAPTLDEFPDDLEEQSPTLADDRTLDEHIASMDVDVDLEDGLMQRPPVPWWIQDVVDSITASSTPAPQADGVTVDFTPTPTPPLMRLVGGLPVRGPSRGSDSRTPVLAGGGIDVAAYQMPPTSRLNRDRPGTCQGVRDKAALPPPRPRTARPAILQESLPQETVSAQPRLATTPRLPTPQRPGSGMRAATAGPTRQLARPPNPARAASPARTAGGCVAASGRFFAVAASDGEDYAQAASALQEVSEPPRSRWLPSTAGDEIVASRSADDVERYLPVCLKNAAPVLRRTFISQIRAASTAIQAADFKSQRAKARTKSSWEKWAQQRQPAAQQSQEQQALAYKALRKEEALERQLDEERRLLRPWRRQRAPQDMI